MDPLEATVDEMIGWWTGLKVSPSGRVHELNHIRGYCRWALRFGYTAADPTRLLDRPMMPRRLPRPIDEDLLQRALQDAPRDVRLIFTLAAYAGLRAGEISRLEWLDIRQKTLLIRGKGSRERIVPIHLLVRQALMAMPGRRRGRVLQRRDGDAGPVPPHLVSHWANNYLHDIAGVSETLHQLRHRFGTQIYQLSQDLRLTQDLLGHATPTMTALYAMWDVTRAEPVVNQLPGDGTARLDD